MLILPYYYGDIAMNREDVSIIRYLIEQKGVEQNILKISKGVKRDYKTVHSIIKRLEKESLVKLESFGQSSRVTLTLQVHPLIFEAEYERRIELLKNKNLIVMLNDLKKGIQTKCFVLLLFGSYPKKKQTKNSDIDLLFIVPNGKEDVFEKDVHRTVSLLPLPIHYLVFSEKQFQEMRDAKDSNVGKEAFNNNIILYGIETYYEMITVCHHLNRYL
jgi:predicted transcriptional regulator